jgi:hypothetical protein
MKYLLTFALLGIFGIASISYSQEIPEGLKEIMEQLQTDPATEYGFDYAKKRGYIGVDVQFSDWHIGLPIEFYKLKGEKLEGATQNSQIENLIETSNIWRIPVRIKSDGYMYHVMVFCENNEFKAVGCGESVLGFRAWDRVRQRYPEESGVRPVVIGMKHKFIFFPDKKDSKKLYYVKNPKWNDELSRITSNSLDSLDDSKKIITYWKKEWEDNKEKRRKFFEKHPDIFKNKAGGEK